MVAEHEDSDDRPEGKCVIHEHPVPPGELDRYAVESDPHSEMDIARYVEIEAQDEAVQHVENLNQ